MQFNTINTKISSMKSKMLRDEDFIYIMNLDSVKEVVEFLIEHTEMKDVLWNLKGKQIHRNDIERRLYLYDVMIIEKLLPYLRDEYRELLNKYYLRYEIEDLKLVFEVVRGKREHSDDIKEHLLTSSKYSKINFIELLEQESVFEVLEKLKGTKYYRLIYPYIESIDEKFSFYIEMILDKYYYHELIAAAQDLPHSQDKKSSEILRRNIDLYNLEWIYRATKYFDMSKEEILNFVLDYGYKYDYQKLKDLVYSFDLQNIKTMFEGSEYQFLFTHDNDIDLYMERRIDRYLYYKALTLYKTSNLDFGKVVAFIELTECETNDIISVIESKRYKMTAKEISKYLIRTIEVN